MLHLLTLLSIVFCTARHLVKDLCVIYLIIQNDVKQIKLTNKHPFMASFPEQLGKLAPESEKHTGF